MVLVACALDSMSSCIPDRPASAEGRSLGWKGEGARPRGGAAVLHGALPLPGTGYFYPRCGCRGGWGWGRMARQGDVADGLDWFRKPRLEETAKETEGVLVARSPPPFPFLSLPPPPGGGWRSGASLLSSSPGVLEVKQLSWSVSRLQTPAVSSFLELRPRPPRSECGLGPPSPWWDGVTCDAYPCILSLNSSLCTPPSHDSDCRLGGDPGRGPWRRAWHLSTKCG